MFRTAARDPHQLQRGKVGAGDQEHRHDASQQREQCDAEWTRDALERPDHPHPALPRVLEGIGGLQPARDRGELVGGLGRADVRRETTDAVNEVE